MFFILFRRNCPRPGGAAACNRQNPSARRPALNIAKQYRENKLFQYVAAFRPLCRAGLCRCAKREAKSFGETARSGRSVPPDKPAQPEKRVKG